jgi:hypothetical protein
MAGKAFCGLVKHCVITLSSSLDTGSNDGVAKVVNVDLTFNKY